MGCRFTTCLTGDTFLLLGDFCRSRQFGGIFAVAVGAAFARFIVSQIVLVPAS
jgi:hypothetical protein